MKQIMFDLCDDECTKFPGINGLCLLITADVNDLDYSTLTVLDRCILDREITVYLNHNYATGSITMWDGIQRYIAELRLTLEKFIVDDFIDSYVIKHIVDNVIMDCPVQEYKLVVVDAGVQSASTIVALTIDDARHLGADVQVDYTAIKSTLAETIKPYTKPRIMTNRGNNYLEIYTGINIRFASGGEINNASTIQHYLDQLVPLTEPCTWVPDEARKLRTLANRLSSMLRDADPMKASGHCYSVDHVVWMLNKIRYSETMTHNEKHQWIGWIQCLLEVVYGLTDTDNYRHLTRVVIKGS